MEAARCAVEVVEEKGPPNLVSNLTDRIEVTWTENFNDWGKMILDLRGVTVEWHEILSDPHKQCDHVWKPTSYGGEICRLCCTVRLGSQDRAPILIEPRGG